MTCLSVLIQVVFKLILSNVDRAVSRITTEVFEGRGASAMHYYINLDLCPFRSFFSNLV